MLKSFEAVEHPFDKTVTYYTATVDPVGAGALLWAAIDQQFSAPDGSPEAEAAAYCLETIPDTPDQETSLLGRGFEWELVECMLWAYGNKATRQLAQDDQFDYKWGPMDAWPTGIVMEIYTVAARARSLAEQIRQHRLSEFEKQVSAELDGLDVRVIGPDFQEG